MTATLRTVALITSSTRKQRLNPFITHYVYNLLPPSTAGISLQVVDLAKQSLPLYDEQVTPAYLPSDNPTPHYTEEHTRSWSALIQQFDAFIFITPQYNWSIPASLKNALDYLFHEWTGKPAGIVSYGGRGGGKAEAHLRDILTGLRMVPVQSAPALSITQETMKDSLDAQKAGEADVQRWRDAGVEEQVGNMWMELMEELNKRPTCVA